MATGPMSRVIRQLRAAALRHDGGELPDGQLLEGFLARRDEAAFAALVRRHGPMVLGVCRRVLRTEQDAEDAFQATFLVLFRKAGTLLRRETVGAWLYGVAYHTALKARAATLKRRAKEQEARELPRPDAGTDEAAHDLRPLLDRELSRLPARYREAVILCDLQGVTRRDAARQLEVPVGTLSGRLTTARRLLAGRLARHGLVLSGGALAAACVPIPLAASTIKAVSLCAAGQPVVSPAVATLSEGVLRAMYLSKLKSAAAMLLVLGAAAVGMGAAWLRIDDARAPDATPAAAAAAPLDADQEPAARPETKRADEPAAAVLFPTRSHDFGAVSGDRQVSCSIPMRNPTKETFRLSGVRVAHPALAASPRSVELTPGDQGTIAVWLDPTRLRGSKSFQLWVHFSEPREEQVLIELKATPEAGGKGTAERPSDGDRVRELEAQLRQLRREVELLQRELRAAKERKEP
jgi:RNA polymerase sigma factor (sigma-70 family)